MGQATQQIDMPAGGIGDFIYTDEEIKLLEKKEVEDQYGTEGIATFNDIGRKMANYVVMAMILLLTLKQASLSFHGP